MVNKDYILGELIMKVIGVILILWGIADFGLSWTGVDIYWEIGINVPSWLYPWTAYIVGIIGYAIFAMGEPSEQKKE